MCRYHLNNEGLQITNNEQLYIHLVGTLHKEILMRHDSQWLGHVRAKIKDNVSSKI